MATTTGICKKILELPSRNPKQIALIVPKNKRWHNYSWSEYFDQIQKVGCSLLKFGITKEDRVGICSQTRHEWSVCDFAILGIGGVTVPIYPNITNEEMIFIINNSGLRILFIENKTTYKQWLMIRQDCPNVELVISFDKFREDDTQLTHFSSFIDINPKEHKDLSKKFSETCAKVELTDIASIVYTSGTTGTPKGAVLTHAQIASEIPETYAAIGVTPEDTTLSFLPYAHILGRIETWGHLYIGFTMAYAEGIERVKCNLAEIKPTVIVAVPRIFEKIYSSILATVEPSYATRKIFHWAIRVGKKVSQRQQHQSFISLPLFFKYKLADYTILNKVKEAFGGRLRVAFSGGAPLSREIAEFFHSSGVLILEGYGLTETTAAVLVNRPFDFEFGTVGKPIGDVEIHLADDGEILIRSQKVMAEYYRDKESTAAVLKKGWFHTGDIGEFTSAGRLKITDRKKDLIKTAGGKYVAPQRLEGLLKQLPYISNVLVHGDQRKYVVVLVTLDKNYVLNFAKEKGISINDFSKIVDQAQIQNLVRKGIAEVNAQLASFESIKRYAILPNEFTIESGELTPSLKVRRKVVDKKYRHLLDSLYE